MPKPAAETPTPAADLSTLSPDAPPAEGEFLNRESSWLEFNRRVLAEALGCRDDLIEIDASQSSVNVNVNVNTDTGDIDVSAGGSLTIDGGGGCAGCPG